LKFNYVVSLLLISLKPGLPAIGIVGAILLTSCDAPLIDHEAEEEGLMQLSRDWSAIANTADIDEIMSHWAEDAVMLPPDMPMLKGKEAIRSYVESSSSIPGFSITREPIRWRQSLRGLNVGGARLIGTVALR
jgi:hypothetical protein